MKWYYKMSCGVTFVRVFMNGAKCGDLCFSHEEFDRIMESDLPSIEFINETSKEPKQ